MSEEIFNLFPQPQDLDSYLQKHLAIQLKPIHLPKDHTLVIDIDNVLVTNVDIVEQT